MLKLKLWRQHKKDTYTIGKLYADGLYFCDTCEDKDRGLKQGMSLAEIKRIKVPRETCIPEGTYKVIVNMSPSKQRLLPRLLEVPGYEGILIHRGNSETDTEGCILVGENKAVGKVLYSIKYELLLLGMIQQAGGAEITIYS